MTNTHCGWAFVVFLGAGLGGPPSGAADVVTFKNDLARTGQNLAETALTHANVNAASFGKVHFLATDGKVDAQPLYLSALDIAGTRHNVVFVASEHDTVYAFDADDGATLWKVSLLGPGETPSGPHGCGQVVPVIGVTATPVINRAAGGDTSSQIQSGSAAALTRTPTPLRHISSTSVARWLQLGVPRQLDVSAEMWE
jgi:outer membrane protein assembly factor BamB